MVFKVFQAKASANYLIRDNPLALDRYNYGTCPIDTGSYLNGRRALCLLCLVSKKIGGVAQSVLFNELWIRNFRTLLRLVKSLASYPENRKHVKFVGIDEVFFANCTERFCNCGRNGCFRLNRYHINWHDGFHGTAGIDAWGAFNEVLKDLHINTFPDVRQVIEMQQEFESRWKDAWHWWTDTTFERVCNLTLRLLIFFSPQLRSLRLTATLSVPPAPYIFRYALGLIPLPTTNIGGFSSINHGNNCADFLTTLSLNLSAFRVCYYGPNLLRGHAFRCIEWIEDLTLVDDGEENLGGDGDDHFLSRGVDPDFLYVWLQPVTRLKKFRLYASLDLEGLPGVQSNLGHNINTILLRHRHTLRHFEWCQMIKPRTPGDKAWKKMFGEERRLWCLPHLRELEYLKLSHMFVYTRQQWIARQNLGAPPRPAPQQAVTWQPPALGTNVAPVPVPTTARPPPAVVDAKILEDHIHSMLSDDLLGLGPPSKLKSVHVVGNLPTDQSLEIEL